MTIARTPAPDQRRPPAPAVAARSTSPSSSNNVTRATPTPVNSGGADMAPTLRPPVDLEGAPVTGTTVRPMGINNIADILRTHASERADARVAGARRPGVTWAELYERAGRVAAGLAAAGVGSQDRVAFLDKNGIEHFEVFFGAALANAVCVDVNWRLAAAGGRVHRQRRRGQGARRRARLRAGARRHRRRADDGRHDPRDRRPREVPGLRRVGRPRTTPVDPQHAERVATTSPSSSTRAARPAAQGRDADQRQLLRPAAGRPRRCGSSTPDSVNLVAMPLFHIGGGGWAVAGMYAGRHERHPPRPRPGGAGPS